MIKKLYLIGIILLTICGCKKESTGEISASDWKNISKIKKDSIYIDENGNKVILKFNSKIEEVPNSINGRVTYSFDIDNNGDPTYDKFGKISRIIYKDNYRNDSYGVTINDDTLDVGEIFTASVWAKYKKYVIEIEEPEKLIIKSEIIQDYYNYEFECSAEGIYSFRGTLLSDSTSVPFEYKFLVENTTNEQ